MTTFDAMTLRAVEAVLEAGDIVRKGFGRPFAKTLKKGIQNFATEFDYASEQQIISSLSRHYPHHSFLAEESGSTPRDNDILWVIDPLDGTLNFAHHIPLFCISVAAISGEEILCGVLYQPMTQELFIAEKGKGAYFNQQKLKVSSTSVFEGSLASTTFPRDVHTNPLGCLDSFERILKSGTIVRNLGSSALSLAYVAAGQLDAYWAVTLHPWDIAAAALLIQEAGGKLTNYQGNAYKLFSEKPLAASNGKLHAELLNYLN